MREALVAPIDENDLRCRCRADISLILEAGVTATKQTERRVDLHPVPWRSDRLELELLDASAVDIADERSRSAVGGNDRRGALKILLPALEQGDFGAQPAIEPVDLRAELNVAQPLGTERRYGTGAYVEAAGQEGTARFSIQENVVGRLEVDAGELRDIIEIRASCLSAGLFWIEIGGSDAAHRLQWQYLLTPLAAVALAA